MNRLSPQLHLKYRETPLLSKYHVRYEAIDGDELLTNEGMSRILD
jgi:hypothetical protein